MKKKGLLLVTAVVLIALALALVGCGGSKSGSASSDQIVVGISSEPTSLDEHQITDYNSDRVANEIYNTLVRFADDSMDIEPDLAESWEISDDGLTYTFHLREGVKFHDGTDFNADAVVWNYERMTNSEAPGYDTGEYGYAEVLFPKNEDGTNVVYKFEATDDKTVVITLSNPYAPFLANLAMTQFSIVSPTAVEKYGKDFGQNPVGTGPYKFDSWESGTEVTLVANEDYFGDKAKINKLIYRFIKDNNVRQNELEAGSIDFMVDIIPDSVETLKNDDNFKVEELASLHTWYLNLNCQAAPFNNVKVRQAFAYAIDKEAIVDGVLLNTGEVAKNFLPPGTPYYTTDIKQYDHNVDEAKKLLQEAGAENLTVDFYVPESGSGMQEADAMATAIQSNLAEAGVTLNIKKLEWGAYLDKMFQGPENQEMLLGEMSWMSDNGDPDNFLSLCSGAQWPPQGFNSAYYKNDELDKLLVEGRQTLDEAKRKEIYTRAQEIVADEIPYIYVDHESQIVAMDKNVENFKLNPRGFFRFAKVTIAE